MEEATFGHDRYLQFEGKAYKAKCPHSLSHVRLPDGRIIQINPYKDDEWKVIKELPDVYVGYFAVAVELTLEERYAFIANECVRNGRKFTGTWSAASDICVWLQSSLQEAKQYASLARLDALHLLIFMDSYQNEFKDSTLRTYLKERDETMRTFLEAAGNG